MVFPATPLDMRVELNLGGTWTDISDYVYQRDIATTTRGRQPEAGQISAAAFNATLNNRDFRFSPRDPLGAYYGLIGLGTVLRWSVPQVAGQPNYLRIEDDQVSYASCPDSAALDITGDLEVQVDFRLSSMRSAALATKFVANGEQSWYIELQPDGTIILFWSTDGSALLSARSTVPIPLGVPGASPMRRVALRVTLDVNNGASGNTVTFYTATSLAGSWTQLGDAVVQSGTTSIFASTAPVTAGNGIESLTGKVYGLKVLSGIGGTVKASPDFTAHAAGTTSFADAQSNTWTMHGSAVISDRDYRFHGEISSLPPRWDTTGKDVSIPVTASGLWQRANRKGQLPGSVMYRAATRLTGDQTPVAYWPCEDAEGSTQIASGIGGPPMILTGAPAFGADASFLCSSPLPQLGGSVWTALIPNYSGATASVMRFLLHVPTTGAVDGAKLALFNTTGFVKELQLVYGTGGTLQLVGFDAAHVVIFDSGTLAFAVNGKLLRVSMELSQSGSNILWAVATLAAGSVTGSVESGTIGPGVIDRVTKVIINRDGQITDTTVGHITVQATLTSIFDLSGAVAAYNLEPAGTRFARLCSEEGFPARVWGYQDQSVVMGPQLSNVFTDLLQECETTDGGMIFEPRDSLALGFRPLSSLTNQSPVVTASYTGKALAGTLQPADDLQRIINDITASRPNGSTSRQVQEDGPLSVQSPPDGVNSLPGSITVNVASDSQLDDEAGWALHMGTVNELRYPGTAFDMTRSATPAAVQDLDLGDLITITDTPELFPPGDVLQLMEGVTEMASGFTWTIAPALAPESPYETGIVEDAVQGHVDTDGTTLHAGITSTATSLKQDGDLWTTVAADFPFDVTMGGEQMTVTNITGSSVPQTWTVTRSVNGVVKAHLTGEDISLAHPAIIALT